MCQYLVRRRKYKIDATLNKYLQEQLDCQVCFSGWEGIGQKGMGSVGALWHFKENFSQCYSGSECKIITALSCLCLHYSTFVVKQLFLVCCTCSLLTSYNFLIYEHLGVRTGVLWKQPPSRTFFSGKWWLVSTWCFQTQGYSKLGKSWSHIGEYEIPEIKAEMGVQHHRPVQFMVFP